MASALVLAMLSGGCANVSWFTKPTGAPFVQPVPNVSPHLGEMIQGIAIDPWGDRFVSFARTISAYDAKWHLMWTNRHPFTGIRTAVNHIGDLEYSNGLLYAPVEEYGGCDDFSRPLIAVYDAWTGALVNWVDISRDEHEASAAAVVADKGQLVISSFCPQNGGASTLWIYSLDQVTNSPAGNALTKEDMIALSSPLGRIQGISWNPKRGQFLVSADTGERAGTLWFISPTGAVAGPVYRVSLKRGIELEGVDATVGNAYYAENEYVYGIPMPELPAGSVIAGSDPIRGSLAGNAP